MKKLKNLKKICEIENNCIVKDTIEEAENSKYKDEKEAFFQDNKKYKKTY